MQTKPGHVRIIGGKWRRRIIKFSSAHIRPTTDFIRETLFNWLTPYIEDAVCLDLFSGSGVLGFEALSRGAKKVIMVDRSPQVITDLRKSAEMLGADAIDFYCLEIKSTLINPFNTKFDLVFIDPPFNKSFVPLCCEWLEKNNLLNDNALIYTEMEKTAYPPKVPDNWQELRSKKSGQVCYALWRRTLEP